MYKIIFKNPENENQKLERKISDFEAKQAFKAQKDKSAFMLRDYGTIPHYLIVTIKSHQEPRPELMMGRTLWETHPPTKEQIQALQLAVVASLPFRVGSTGFFMGIVQSVWNWNSERTNDLLEFGQSLVDSGETMKTLINALSKQT